MKGRPKNKKRIMGELLRLNDFELLAHELKRWRTPELRALEKEKGAGLVLGFVKGLKLSAGLIYALRKTIGGRGPEVHWGHLLDPSENSCSPECDVIIHKGHLQEWNGHDKPVMDFKFVKCEKAIAVISCKSFLKEIDKEYPGKLMPYVRTVFLFAECCAPGRINLFRKQAKAAGYSDFCCLYTYDERTSEPRNLPPNEWLRFLSEVVMVAERAVLRKIP